jgi:hypothetical protein
MTIREALSLAGALTIFVLSCATLATTTVHATSCTEAGQYIGASCSAYTTEWCIGCVDYNCRLFAGSDTNCFNVCNGEGAGYC